MAKIPLTQGKFAEVDDADFDLLAKFKWQAEKHAHTFYAGTTFKSGRRVRMHRLILNPAPGFVIDHLDHDGLNNQRSNIRVTTQSENRINSRKSPTASSKHTGVSFQKSRNKWIATIKVGAKYVNLGRFADEESANRAREDFKNSLGM